MIRKIKSFFRINWIKTIVFNFKTFNFKTAARLPVFIYGQCDFVTHKGAIEISNVRSGILLFGRIRDSGIYGNKSVYPSIVKLYSTIKMCSIEGGTQMGGGIKLVVEKDATLTLGSDVSIGHNSLIYVSKKISFGNHVSVSWECQFYDTDFHYILAPNNMIAYNKKPVCIGNNVWIGNRVTIQKGSVPSSSIVGSNSLVSTDYSNSKGGVYVGVPAKIIKEGYRRIFGVKLEKEISRIFETNPSKFELDISRIDTLRHITKHY